MTSILCSEEILKVVSINKIWKERKEFFAGEEILIDILDLFNIISIL